MTITEKEFNDLRRALRAEIEQSFDSLRQELFVSLLEKLAEQKSGPTVEQVQQMISDAAPAPAEVTPSDFQGLTNRVERIESRGQPAPFNDQDIHQQLLRLRLHVAGIADMVGAPRMEN